MRSFAALSSRDMSDATPVPETGAGIPATGVSLVLGSGGARGYAHIGVIEELLGQGFRIESIAGSSMGALVGGVYAAGKLDQYRSFARIATTAACWSMVACSIQSRYRRRCAT